MKKLDNIQSMLNRHGEDNDKACVASPRIREE